MGDIDVESRAYFSDDARFADVFNFYVYAGEQVVKPEQLVPLDTAAIGVPYGIDARNPEQRVRDVLKLWKAMCDERAVYVVLGLESQTDVHYAMPVRCGLYDFLNYAHQVEEAARSYRRSHGGGETPSRAEYLSGFHKDDRLMPVITIVVHLGPEVWEGPRSIHEMLEASDDGRLMGLVPDYRINLISPAEVADADFDRFATHVGLALKYIKYSKDKRDLDRVVHEDERYRAIDRDTAELVNLVTNSQLAFGGGEERVDMCKAIEDMRRESRDEGIAQGRAEGVLQGRAEGMAQGRAEGMLQGRAEGREDTLRESVRSLMENMRLSAEQAMDALGLSAEDRAKVTASL